MTLGALVWFTVGKILQKAPAPVEAVVHPAGNEVETSKPSSINSSDCTSPSKKLSPNSCGSMAGSVSVRTTGISAPQDPLNPKMSSTFTRFPGPTTGVNSLTSNKVKLGGPERFTCRFSVARFPMLFNSTITLRVSLGSGRKFFNFPDSATISELTNENSGLGGRS